MKSIDMHSLQCGNIVLYNKKDHSAKILNIYNSYTSGDDDSHGADRVYAIDKSGTIWLFDDISDEGGPIFILKKHKVKILKDGQVLVENLKQ